MAASATRPATTPVQAAVHALCQWLAEHRDQPVSLAAMARHTGYSPAYLQRQFKAHVGVTPRDFHAACRHQALRGNLKSAASVTEAVFAAGFGSSSRVYENAATHLGMTPGAYRAGGAGTRISYALTDCPLGRLLLAATDRGVCAVKFGDQDAPLLDELHGEFPHAEVTAMPGGSDAPFADWMAALQAHLADARVAADLPMDVRGTAFQWTVWRYLQTIPAGTVRSYAEVAQAIGKPRAVRAVGTACGANQLAVIIPCHRVLRGDGSLGGYRWGLDRKRALIAAERRIAPPRDDA